MGKAGPQMVRDLVRQLVFLIRYSLPLGVTSRLVDELYDDQLNSFNQGADSPRKCAAIDAVPYGGCDQWEMDKHALGGNAVIFQSSECYIIRVIADVSAGMRRD